MHQLIDHLIAAFRTFHIPIRLCEIESLATTIHRAMKTSARSYHTLEHILHLADCSEPLQSLAALFHDIVYYHVDQGFSPEVGALVENDIIARNNMLHIRDKLYDNDALLHVTLDIFGFVPGQVLSPSHGQNEFLSALFMNRRLGSFLPLTLLMQTSAYIEATIPFRQDCWMLKLKKRLRNAALKYRLAFSPEELDEIIRASVQFSNRDVDDFSEPDIGRFLSGTWELLAEYNSSLRSGHVYSIRDYRKALQNMEQFFAQLAPENIFHRYQNTPPLDVYHHLQRIARRNVSIACEYLEIKLLTIAIIEALAELTGGDAPLALFMGDLKKNGARSAKRLEDLLPAIDPRSSAPLSPIVSHLLENGRSGESSFDNRKSPTSFFLSTQLDAEEIHHCVTRAHEMFHGMISAQKFLHELDSPVVSHIASACAEMVVTRREELLALAKPHVIMNA
ncbi:hypothetical protein CSB45_12125 [candidate division KSB3 bacterium]|uniref:HD domain-containing protein n=1 Tax=candidate division KSB3 bacterium TaxID=2044937 RepID=A0A2G6E3E1_9BACT|nr:MAG: hypothetical protein CSB45_12125 [candidate division KSB3 bacterium]PIE28844.1 MAG: hypothetical protein CSA57_11800 [candidate division KSB3 bacterium]